MQHFDQQFLTNFRGATPGALRREGDTPSRTFIRPHPRFLTPNNFDAPPPLSSAYVTKNLG